MRLMLLVGVLATMALAAPLDEAQATPAITEYRNEPDGLGGYRFSYRTSDGTFREETGRIQNDVLMVSGSVSWIAPDGQEYSINYVSDEGGYRPMGTHLPSSTSPRLNIPKTNVRVPSFHIVSLTKAAKDSLLG